MRFEGLRKLEAFCLNLIVIGLSLVSVITAPAHAQTVNGVDVSSFRSSSDVDAYRIIAAEKRIHRNDAFQDIETLLQWAEKVAETHPVIVSYNGFFYGYGPKVSGYDQFTQDSCAVSAFTFHSHDLFFRHEPSSRYFEIQVSGRPSSLSDESPTFKEYYDSLIEKSVQDEFTGQGFGFLAVLYPGGNFSLLSPWNQIFDENAPKIISDIDVMLQNEIKDYLLSRGVEFTRLPWRDVWSQPGLVSDVDDYESHYENLEVTSIDPHRVSCAKLANMVYAEYWEIDAKRRSGVLPPKIRPAPTVTIN